jgi:hypothetical protein
VQPGFVQRRAYRPSPHRLQTEFSGRGFNGCDLAPPMPAIHESPERPFNQRIEKAGTILFTKYLFITASPFIFI